ncbi:hypothetical protein VPH35_011834 [Triticum aestivum]
MKFNNETHFRSKSAMLALAFLVLMPTDTTIGWPKPDTWRTHDQGGCIMRDREALLSIKARIMANPERLLSSWRGQDCCRWEGVTCSNMIGHVIELDLHAPYNIQSSLKGEISSSLKDLEHLQFMDLGGNYNLDGFQGHLPDFIGSLRDLRYLNLSYLNFNGMLCEPQCVIGWVDTVNMLASLEILRLSSCSLNNKARFVPRSNLIRHKIVDISSNSVQMQFDTINWAYGTTSLKYLNLERNSIYGMFPAQLGNLSSLEVLQLNSNYLKGIGPLHTCWRYVLFSELDGLVTKDQFSKLTKLQGLHLYANSFTMGLNYDWVPPFRLQSLGLTSCRLGPEFPKWLKSQESISFLFMSDGGIADAMPDCNNISGTLPATIGQMKAVVLDLSSNQFTGLVQQLPQHIDFLDVSRNSLSGPLPLFLNFGWPYLPVPRCSENVASGSRMVPLNTASPESDSSSHMQLSMSIGTLRLANNNLSDAFSLLLQNCPGLTFIDLGQNKFFGSIPTWIGKKLPQLKYLHLRSNMFSGYIAAQLSELCYLQYLNIAHNNFSVSIPQYLLNMDGVAKTTKIAILDNPSIISSGMAIVDDYDGVDNPQDAGRHGFYFIKSILYIGPTSGLVSMNLSLNHLGGKIPESIGLMHSLESLDLSNNQLFGEIPSSLSDLTFLSYLNLSYNNLLGRIPSGHQLDTLNPGDPASICSGNHIAESPSTTSREGSEMMPFYFGLSLGFMVGLWVVFCSLLFKKTWRISYFQFFDEVCDEIYVLVVVNWARMMWKATTTTD